MQMFIYTLKEWFTTLNKLDEAMDFSAKVEMTNDKNALAKEFILRYQIYKLKDNPNLMEKFLYTNYNLDFVKQSENNPSIIDFIMIIIYI